MDPLAALAFRGRGGVSSGAVVSSGTSASLGAPVGKWTYRPRAPVSQFADRPPVGSGSMVEIRGVIFVPGGEDRVGHGR